MATDDFFRARLDGMIDMRHPLAVLTTRVRWSQVEGEIAPFVAHQDREGQVIEGVDLFGPTLQVVGAGVSNAGRPRLPIRLMVTLLYLKHAYGLSDEELCERWSENVLWQFFSGREYFEHALPCDPTQVGRFRKLLGEAGGETMLRATIETAAELGVIKPRDCERVIVDTTVQEKAVAHPTDSRLLEIARAKVAQQAKRAGIAMKQTYEHEGRELRRRAGGYAHAKQFKRLRKVLRRQRVILGRLLRDVERKMAALPEAARSKLALWIERAKRLHAQRREDKGKLYALHAPEVECIGKGKARQPFEFGVKTSVAVTMNGGLVVGARTFPGNPYDGHTLAAQIEQTTTLLERLRVKPTTAIVDLGYRGVDHLVPVEVIHRGRFKTMAAQQRRWLKRRQAVEPVIGHLKADHGMRRCWLKGQDGDAIHAVLCAAGFNLRWLLRAIAARGLRALLFALRAVVAMLMGALIGRLQAPSARWRRFRAA